MRSRDVLLLTVVIAIGLGATCPPAWATFPGSDGRIAFSSDAAGDLDIWTVNPDGSGATNLTGGSSAPAFALEPDGSPDGSKIAFRAGRADAAEIYTMSADGSGITQLTSNAFKDYAPTWSPDGTEIAFASNRNDPSFATCVSRFDGCIVNIFVMPATGGSPVQATFGLGTDQNPTFSPDGRFIAYSSNVSGAFAIYKVDLDTFSVTKLTPDSLRAGDPDWSPDGTKIAFDNNFQACKTGTSTCTNDVFVMPANGGTVTQLTHQFGDNYDSTWSPQGDKIAFTHAKGAQFKQQQNYTMNPGGTEITRITHNNDENFTPDWGSG
jgi:Tol biopolymer transport system component